MISTSVVLLGLLISLVLWRRNWHGAKLPLPAGPKPWPFIGNFLDMPRRNIAPALHALCRKFGDIVYLNNLGQPIIVIDTYDAAVAILDTRTASTSDRPRLVMTELAGMSWALTFQRYGPRWRRNRRTFHESFGHATLPRYWPTHLRQTRRLLHRLLVDSAGFRSHTHVAVAGSVLGVMYGIDVVDGNDRHLEVAERGASVFDTAIVPGRYLVETIPVLSKLPAWFPFAQFKRDAAALAKYVYAARNDPYEEVIQSLAQGTAQPSILSTLIEQAIQEHGKVPPEDEEHFKDVSAVAYIAGVDSSVTTILVFFLAMIMHPRVQARAQEELDNIIGPERLPTFGDRDAVPYINALIKECIRWRSIIPLSVFHRAVDDVEYDGHLFPKGSTLIANAWAMSRDPVAYPDPESFIPERFLKNGKLDPDVRDPSKFLFGFGRRICPGQYFAGDVLFIIIASILHAFKIEPQLDERGQPIPVTADLPLDSGVSHPGPFECKITPRSSAVAALIRQSFAND